MSKKIGIIGGDLRIIKLAEILAKEDYFIYVYALEKANVETAISYSQRSNVVKCKSINEVCRTCDNIISGIPFSKDGIHVYAPFSNDKLEVENLLEEVQNKTLIAGAIKLEIKQKAKKVNIIDLMENECLTIQNIIPTVEGAIQIAMEETEITINNSKCLVLGYGRIGKLLCKTLKDMGAKVSCMARKEKDLTWINTYGYKPVNINNLEEELECKYDIIFNTIPSLILDSKKLELIKNRETLIIELASLPGGIDFDKANEYNIKVIKALGLPGKVAPYTAARYIKETLEKILK